MSHIVERMSDQAQDAVLRLFDHKPPSTPEVVQAHEDARRKCRALASWAMNHLPPGNDLGKALDAIFTACVALNTAIAQTQLMGDVERMLAKKPSEPSP